MLSLLTSVIRRRIVEVPGGGSATWGMAATSEPLSSSLETTSATPSTVSLQSNISAMCPTVSLFGNGVLPLIRDITVTLNI